ncbi:pancreatic triacylglycerol lipase-like [Polistes fuscatus]|uniref:pancreatic triacylglycerol lipase-like n=1 Tax=Polistes fuscatus TaxID=30207 RepID=UPI001CA947AE|nr:pancreatic triacylglycerol lipase-like [Polistes fuscatus]
MGTPFVFLAFFCTLSLYFATTDGIPTTIAGKSMPSNDDLIDLIESLSRVKFLLYTQKDPNGYALKFLDVKNIFNSTWDSSKRTKFITHGWLDNAYSTPCAKIRNAFLAAGDFNVVVIDWEPIATDFYFKAKESIPGVAKYVAKFMNFINAIGGLDFDETLLVGHGLGAHLISLSAKYSDGKIGQVLGLDPVGRGYSDADENTRIDKSHAEYVQIIHTNSGKLGLDGNFGTADFIVNGGKSQPGCGYLDIFGTCAHAQSYEYYAESILNADGFKGTRCNESTLCLTANMGGPTLDTSAVGVYEVTTASTPPYALG